jgi:N utilization substance protein A
MENVHKAEILQIIEAVSRERGISKNKLIEAMEQAVQIAGRKKYGQEQNIIAQIDHNTGKISLFRARKIKPVVENILQDISLEDALAIRSDAQLDEEILDPLPPIDICRVAAQTAKNVIGQRVNEIERESQYEDYKDRKGDILNGAVKRIEFGDIFVDVGRAEAILKKNQQIPGEMFKVGDRIKAYVQDVRREPRGAQIFLSRTDEGFLRKLFETEVPEIYDNAIEIKSIARDAGSKAKVAVFAPDVNLDPIGSCVGVRGARVKAITNELNGEKIDLVLWDRNIAQFVINAMMPATISKIVFNEDQNKVEIIVAEDQLSLAIGRRGQNVRLASRLTGHHIDVMTEADESKRRGEVFSASTNLFVHALGMDEVTAQLLATEGFHSIEQLAFGDVSQLETIQGFNMATLEQIRANAIAYVEKQNEQIIEKLEQLGVEQELLDVVIDLSPEYILKIAEFGVKTLEDLAEVTVAELRDIVPSEVATKEQLQDLINFAKENIKS